MNGWILALVLIVVMVVALGIWFQAEREAKERDKETREVTNMLLDIIGKKSVVLDRSIAREQILQQLIDDSLSRMRHWHKENAKLQQRLNRISNLTIGNERIWRLDEIANEFEITADIAKEEPVETDPDREVRNREIALFIRRLEWDLGEIHEAVRGATNRRGGRYDGANWKGVRP